MQQYQGCHLEARMQGEEARKHDDISHQDEDVRWGHQARDTRRTPSTW